MSTFMKENPPKISVITVTYNRLSDLHKTFHNVLSQSYFNVEYIIIDGSSKDGTLDFLHKNSDKISFWVSEPDNGIYDAMNKGASLASGDWIIYMNSGDTFFSENTLSEVVSYLNDQADIVYGGVEAIIEDKYQRRVLRQEPLALSELWRNMPTCHQSIFVRRELQVQFPFDTSFIWCADHDFIVKLYLKRFRFQVIPVVISKFDATGGHRDILIHTKERWRISKNLAGYIKRNTYFVREYCGFLFWKHIATRVRDVMPNEWILTLRKYRGTY
ncbi:MAG: glycosyltransferase [Anaerolineae bacterium]|nr:glycosyltransferase [Anaerolineae bacterium]